MNLTILLGKLLKQVAKSNNDNPEVKTADPVVFEEMQKKFENLETQEETQRSRGDLYKDYYEKVKEAQVENEASPTVETADASVYDQMMKEIEKLKEQVNSQNNAQANIPQYDNSGSSAPSTNMESRAMTNSMGGSLQIRTAPNMGAESLHVRIPDETIINVLEYSDNKIILDGRESRFVKIEFNGQTGWVLENYLNFN